MLPPVKAEAAPPGSERRMTFGLGADDFVAIRKK